MAGEGGFVFPTEQAIWRPGEATGSLDTMNILQTQGPRRQHAGQGSQAPLPEAPAGVTTCLSQGSVIRGRHRAKQETAGP